MVIDQYAFCLGIPEPMTLSPSMAEVDSDYWLFILVSALFVQVFGGWKDQSVWFRQSVTAFLADGQSKELTVIAKWRKWLVLLSIRCIRHTVATSLADSCPFYHEW
jgi:hypothetical protein